MRGPRGSNPRRERELLAGGKLRKLRNRSNPRGGFVSSPLSPPSLTCNPPHVAPVRPLQRCRAPNVDQWAAIAQTSPAPSPSCFPAIGNPPPPPPQSHQLFRRVEGEQGEPIGWINTLGQEGLEHKVCSRKFVVWRFMGNSRRGMIFSLTDFLDFFTSSKS